jgi:hypothetical protein
VRVLPLVGEPGAFTMTRPCCLSVDRPPDMPLDSLRSAFLEFVSSVEGRAVVSRSGLLPVSEETAP